jgi:diguanylate cyclase (GGDEF)-like protein
MSAGIGTRLVALVALPLAALGVVAATFVVHEQQSVEDARDALAGIEEVETLTVALSAVYAEATTSEVLLQSRFPSERIPDPSFLSNAAIRKARLDGRRLLDGTMQNHPDLRRIIDTTELQEARALVDAPDATPSSIPALVERFDRIRAALEAEVDGQLRRLAQRAGAVDASLQLGRCIDAQRATTAVIRTVIELQRAGLEVWFGDDMALAQRRLVLARGQFESAIAAARGSGVEKATTEIDAMYRALASATVLSYVDELIENPTTPPAPLAAIGMIDQVVANALALNALMLNLTADATDRTVAVRDDRSTRQQTLVIWSAVTALAIVVTSLIVAQGIRRPLRGLGVAAGRLRRGDLGAATGHLGGPPEVRDAAAALGELRESLVLAEAQGRALAAADLDAEVLHRSSPGPLGDLVRETFTTLSESIRDSERLRERLAYQASHDALTNLANRAAALVRLEELLTAPAPDGDDAAEPVAAVLFIDLDQFKEANDRFGHAAGDEVLRAVAERMRSSVGDADVVARLGGDEFMVIARSARTDDEACALGRTIARLVAEPVPYLGHEIRVRAGVGVALARRGDGANDVLRDADLAVYESKRTGNGVVTSYEASLARSVAQRHRDIGALHAALADGHPGLQVTYRPVHRFAGGDEVRLEADVRWRRDDGRVLDRDALVALAETGEAAGQLDLWLLRTAVEDLARWRRAAKGVDVAVDVRLSPRTVRGAVNPGAVLALVGELGVPGSALTIEVDETDLCDDPESAAALAALRTAGVRTAIRDFGPGGLSTADLRRVAVDVVKVHADLVQLATDHPDDPYPAAIVALVRHLGCTAVARGVVTERHREAVERVGFCGAAGPYFGRPLVADDVPHLLAITPASSRGRWDAASSAT